MFTSSQPKQELEIILAIVQKNITFFPTFLISSFPMVILQFPYEFSTIFLISCSFPMIFLQLSHGLYSSLNFSRISHGFPMNFRQFLKFSYSLLEIVCQVSNALFRHLKIHKASETRLMRPWQVNLIAEH